MWQELVGSGAVLAGATLFIKHGLPALVELIRTRGQPLNGAAGEWRQLAVWREAVDQQLVLLAKLHADGAADRARLVHILGQLEERGRGTAEAIRQVSVLHEALILEPARDGRSKRRPR